MKKYLSDIITFLKSPIHVRHTYWRDWADIKVYKLLTIDPNSWEELFFRNVLEFWIDELPQLYNIFWLRNMTWVWPRPVLKENINDMPDDVRKIYFTYKPWLLWIWCLALCFEPSIDHKDVTLQNDYIRKYHKRSEKYGKCIVDLIIIPKILKSKMQYNFNKLFRK